MATPRHTLRIALVLVSVSGAIEACNIPPPLPPRNTSMDALDGGAALDGSSNLDASSADTQDSGVIVPPSDGGVLIADADAGQMQSTPDAGTMPFDAGMMPFDAGMVNVPDAGAGGIDGVPNSPAMCSSGVTWLLGDLGTDLMHPGVACIQCHSQHHAPAFTAAGTVYPTTHEPDDCDGKNGGVQVVITDATGNVLTLTTNIVGTFHTSDSIALPYTAKVVSSNGTRSMLTPQMSGDCNSCHTQNGANGAPGRIVAP